MQQILNVSCGLDIHKDTIEACMIFANGATVPTVERATFTTMRGDIFRLRDWIISNDCLNVAMESTGVYWRPIYEILEEEGMNLAVVNSAHMRNLPGRKSDQEDAEWIASLYMCGLLDKSFVPEKGIRALREYTRFHVKLTQSRTRIINRIEKHLQMHGFKLSSVLSSIVGVSSLRILELLSRNGEVGVAEVKNALERGVKKTSGEIAYAINGKLSHSSQRLLRIMLDSLYSYEKQLASNFEEMRKVAEPYDKYIRLLSTIPGIDKLSATYIVAEISVDMSHYKKGSGSLAMWAGLSPRDDKSAGVVKSKKILKGNPYVKSILCQCAWAASKTRGSRPSNWFWRNNKRLGSKTAIIALARKLLVYAYNIINTQKQYDWHLDIADTERINALKLASAKQQLSDSKKRNGFVINTIEIKSEQQSATDKKKKPSIKGKANKVQKSPISKPVELSNIPASHNPSTTSEGHVPCTNETPMPKKRGRPKKKPADS